MMSFSQCGDSESPGEVQVYPKMDVTFAGDFLMKTPRKADVIRRGLKLETGGWTLKLATLFVATVEMGLLTFHLESM